MAIIYTYPEKLQPTQNDLLLISDKEDKNKTKTVRISTIQSLTSGIFGGGLVDRIPVWTSANTLGNSSFLQTSSGGGVSQIGTRGSVLIGTNSGALVSATTNQNNVALGDESLKSFIKGLNGSGVETSGENVAIGYQSLTTTTGGTNNVGIGVDTLGSLTLGANNIAFGKKALFSLTGPRADTASNIAMGFDSLGDLATGKNNVAIGQSIYDLKTTLLNAVAIGRWAGKAFTGDADESVVIGANSLISSTATSVKNSVIIGESAGQATSGTLADDILIGTSAFNSTVSAGSNIAIGRVANQNSGSSTALTGSIAIGTTGGTSIGSGGTANSYSTIIGSYDTADAAVGSRNSTEGKYSAILGGIGNTNGADYGMIIGGRNNIITTGASNAAILGGFNNSVSGTGSAGMALGSNLIVSGNNQVAVGRWNESKDNTKFVVGAGTSNTARKNVFEVLNTGQLRATDYGSINFAQTLTDTFNLLTTSATGSFNQITQAQISALPSFMTPNTRGLVDGQAVNLPATIGSLEILTWSGAAGSAELRLPSALPTNRAITFVIDSTFTTNFVRIKFSGATLATLQYSDAAVSVFRAATLWYDGTSYYVISNTVVNP